MFNSTDLPLCLSPSAPLLPTTLQLVSISGAAWAPEDAQCPKYPLYAFPGLGGVRRVGKHLTTSTLAAGVIVTAFVVAGMLLYWRGEEVPGAGNPTDVEVAHEES
eukprot:scaffold7068_cov301-Pinguiococcus_pyrenoidosus.AAC.19